MRFLLLLLFICGIALGTDYVPYGGLRLDMSALTLNRDIISTIVPALNRTRNYVFPAYMEAGSFGTKLKVMYITIPYYKINEELFNMTTFEYKYPIYHLKGAFEAIYFHIDFGYELTWLGIPINTGTGHAAITNLRSEILVFWNESDPDVQLPHPWDICNITIHPNMFGPKDWIKSMLHKEFIYDFHNAVDRAMDDFAHNLLKTYRRIEDIFPDENIDLVFYNDVYNVQPAVNGNYLSISFRTNMTVNGDVHKKIFREMNSSVVPQGDFDYCLAAELVPDVLDAMGKGGYNDVVVSPEAWGFKTNTVQEFFNILPSLKEKYLGDEEYVIHCQYSREETVNDVTQIEWMDPLLELQSPMHCYLFTIVDSNFFLVVDIFMRFYYELKCKNESFYGHVRSAAIKSFRSLPQLPEKKHEILEEHVLIYTFSFNDKELLSPGIKVLPNRKDELIFDWAYTKSEEICFYYREKRPI